jgi:hypothetical protein
MTPGSAVKTFSALLIAISCLFATMSYPSLSSASDFNCKNVFSQESSAHSNSSLRTESTRAPDRHPWLPPWAATVSEAGPLIAWSKLPFTQKASVFILGILRGVGGTFKTTADLFLPWPLPVFNKNAIIYNKQLTNPDYAPSPIETNYLNKSSGGLRAFENRREWLRQHKWWLFIGRTTSRAKKIAALTVLSLTIQQAYLLEMNTETFDSFLSSQNSYENPIVQILVETTPFPHAAIRIGDRVYSYGVSHMTSSSIYEYLASPITEVPPTAMKSALQMELSAIWSAASQRSVKAVDLHLDPQVVLQMRRELELSTAKTYKNITGVNDCATMIARILSRDTGLKIPTALDPYPITAAAYLSLRSVLGDPRIGKTTMLISAGSNAQALLARNTWISLIEAKTMLKLLPLSLSQRVYFDLDQKNDELEYYGPTVQAELQKWKTDIRTKVHQELNAYGTNEVDQISRQKRSLIITEVIDPEIRESTAIINSANVEFQDIVTSEIKLEALTAEKARLLKSLSDQKVESP